jgi:hypothetical protein
VSMGRKGQSEAGEREWIAAQRGIAEEYLRKERVDHRGVAE